MSRLTHVDDHTCRHFRYSPTDMMVFFTSDRSGAAYGVVQMPIAPSAAARQIRTGQGGGIRRWVVAQFAALPQRICPSGPSGRPHALCVGRFEDGWPKDRPCRHVGGLYVSGDTTRGLEVSTAWPQAQCPRQIVSSTPRHSYEAASRNETRSARRRPDMLARRHDDMS